MPPDDQRPRSADPMTHDPTAHRADLEPLSVTVRDIADIDRLGYVYNDVSSLAAIARRA